MLLTYVIPVHNRTKQLREVVESILKQEGRECEIIVIDDASSVDCRGAIADLIATAPVSYHRLPVNVGPTGAKNAGATLATAEYIVFIDSDDLLAANAPEIIKRTIQQSGERLIFFACSNEVGELMYKANTELGRLTYNKLLSAGPPGEFLPVVERNLIRTVKFPEELRGFEHITWLSCAKLNGGAFYSTEVARIYRTAGADRICAPANMLRDTRRLAIGWARFVEIFHDDLWSIRKKALVAAVAKTEIYTRHSGASVKIHSPSVVMRLTVASIRFAIRILPRSFIQRLVQNRFGKT